MKCTLCYSTTNLFYEYIERGLAYHQCTGCNSVLLDPAHYLRPEQEKAHYLTHENDVNDPGYQQFVSPIVKAVMNNQVLTEKGLDFGSGTGPVITKLLKDANYDITTYDPFFDANPLALTNTYNYIICSEVMEHFHNPHEEFKVLSSLLNKSGNLYCMTQLYHEGIDFKTWRYKNDPTHTIFYHADAISYIAEEFGFHSSFIEGRLIVLNK